MISPMEISPPTRGLLGGRYRIEAPLGWGGAGEVWQGRHAELGARVAIKLLRPGLALGARARRRFLNEARVMAQLDTSHAIRVHDIGVSDEGIPFLVMDLVDGESLAQKLRRERRLQPGTAVRLLGQAARGLERAHGMGIVHRDFKPANVLLSVDEDGLLRARVTDFGMAKLLRALEEVGDEGGAQAVDQSTTGMVGTPYYMAPEQFSMDQRVSPQTDVWALGVVAYECLTGRRPFEGDRVEEVQAAILRGRAAPASSVHRALPLAFDSWFSRACALSPEDRFSSARFAIDALSDALEVSTVLLPQAAISAKIELLERRAERVDPLATTLVHRERPSSPRPSWRGWLLGGALLGVAALMTILRARSGVALAPAGDAERAVLHGGASSIVHGGAPVAHGGAPVVQGGAPVVQGGAPVAESAPASDPGAPPRGSTVPVGGLPPESKVASLGSQVGSPVVPPSQVLLAPSSSPVAVPSAARGPGPLPHPGLPAYRPFPEASTAPRLPASFKADPY
jgi:tRNA A-37 threonylcarbamoyl transferase component Bud32